MRNLDNKFIYIGSVALNAYIDMPVTKDVDMIMTYESFKSFIKSLSNIKTFYPISDGKKYLVKTSSTIFEIEIAWPNSSSEQLLEKVLNDNLYEDTFPMYKLQAYVPNVDVLYTLKMSHRYKKNSPHFLKTMEHIKLMREYGAKIFDEEWYKLRQKETYVYKHPALNVDKQSFFKDETFYKYDHDDIHEAIKLFDKPMYRSILKDGAKVDCSKEKFEQLNYLQRLACAIEEVMVLSLERGLIPNNFEVDARKMYNIAAMKVCTSVTSGWFREFCWENYDFIILYFDCDNYVDRFKNALYNGNVRNFEHDRVYK